MNDDTVLITTYVGAWAWHIIAVIFLHGLILMLVLNKFMWTLGFAGVIFFAEFMAWLRKREVEDMENET